MQDFRYYSDIDVKYPNDKDYKTVFVYHSGEVLGKVPASEYKKEDYPKNHVIEVVFDEKRYREHQSLWGKSKAEKEQEFKFSLFEEFGVEDNPKRELCYSLAWEHGQSAGYSEVYAYFLDFVELIK